MLTKGIYKIATSIVKFILPFISKIFIKLRINRRVINFLDNQSFLANNYYNFSNIIKNLIKEEKIIALDVGAQGGFNSDSFFPKKYNVFFKTILVEPIKEEAAKLKKNSKYVIDKALWSSSKVKSIFILENRLGSSSMYEPDTSTFKIHSIKKKDYNNFKVTKKVDVECEELDVALKKLSIKELDYLKLDTQGSELEILKGMKDYSPLLIRAEAHVFSMYKNVPNWSDLLQYLYNLDYICCDWRSIGSHATRIPAEMDIIFIPNYKKESGKKLILENKKKFISLMLIFGHLNLLKIVFEELNLELNSHVEDLNDRFFF